MDTDLVRNSREGDVFHYRWAARRCLRLINPKSSLKCVVIEGSKESALAGEYVIDVAEYSDAADSGKENVTYFQLKHSTKRVKQHFNLSDLKNTIKGFANRYKKLKNGKVPRYSAVTFAIVTNRPISDKFKKGIYEVGKGKTAGKGFQGTLEKYTKLKGKNLQAFCASLEFIDGEGNYNAQRYELHAEIARLVAGTVDSSEIDSVIALVSDPDQWNRPIYREAVLQRFDVTSINDLFPAPPEFEQLPSTIKRGQHDFLLDQILKAATPVIIHASAGVGKSVFARQLADSFPAGSIGIVYDCFGAGKYRNRSRPRHRHRDALVQVANELASQGLCKILIPRSTDLDDTILRAFLDRLRTAAETLRKVKTEAIVAVLIDAADNAEIAAKEFSDSCFAHQLLRETVPDECRIIALCRTERVDLLEPSNVVRQLKLENFSDAETLAYLQSYFPNATKADSMEFHRLTGGNPRVQANALNISRNTILDIFTSLGPEGTTVNEQISAQLESAVSKVKEMLPADFQKSIEAICLGLANLPPLIPINVLAAAAQVNESAVKSFVADLGRPLWIADASVQFRDEPTETWFRKKFSASAEQIESLVTRLKPLASKFSYVAEALPFLLLQSENYDQLISLALSEDFLSEDNPIDKRNVRVHRLQFAFKAALKKRRYADATKLALLAGEEVSGDKRQLELLKENVDLIAPLQSEQRVQELAFRRLLGGAWNGSENVYSAALLSSVEDFKGEARAYLRAAENWLRLYFEEHKKKKEEIHNERLTDDDIVELAFTKFNLFGSEGFVDFILSWRPLEVIFRVARMFIRRLVDAGEFTAIDEISQFGNRNQYLMVAIADELLAVGQYPPKEALKQSLDLLSHKQARIKRSRGFSIEDTITPAILSFAEACAATRLPNSKILRVLNYYIPKKASRLVSDLYYDKERPIFLRGVALRTVLMGNGDPDIDSLMPSEFMEKSKDFQRDQDVKEFREVVGGLLPWYVARARFLAGHKDDFNATIEKANKLSTSARAQRWREHDRIPYEIARVQFDILAFNNDAWGSASEKLAKTLSASDRFWLKDRLRAVRTAYRLDHLSGIRAIIEQTCREIVDSAANEGPETRAEWYIDLARAVLPLSRADASAYFNYAIEAVSKFGDEIVERWEAVVAVAKRLAEGGHSSPEIAYRFIRCAELVGDNVAREKNFNRDEAVRVCAKLSPSSAFTALSRWRDRDVGWLDRQLPALADEVVSSKVISTTVGWSLSAFSWEYGIIKFAALCIENESDEVRRKYILDTAVRDQRLRDYSEKDWKQLKDVANRFVLKNAELERVLAFHAEHIKVSTEAPKDQISRMDYEDKSKNIDWTKVLGDLDLTTAVGVSNAIDRFNALPSPRDSEVFWKEVFKRISDTDASNFLQAIAIAESLDRLDVQSALSCFPDTWRGKASVERIWVSTLSSIARRFASELTNAYSLNYFLKSIRAEDNVVPSLQKGILQGLSETCDLVDASTFFDFVGIASSFITPEEAVDLLDFALSRFEKHVNEDYADGPWASWLLPPKEFEKAFAGFVWAALGSPRSSVRWQAAHCVRRLAEMGCTREIDALIEWMLRNSVDAFGSHKFPFYNLHARQYLLMALARVAIDNPEILKHQHAIFADLSLSGVPHVLIQKYATEIAMSIETAFPGTYDRSITERFPQVGISQMLPKEVEGYGKKFESPRHAKGEIDKTLELHFSYDFDRYWFEPLGEVFGISGDQVEALAREVVLKDWRIKLGDDSIHDPRNKLWRFRHHERETWHSHGSYPRTDDYSFYLSHHAVLTVAAKLLGVMPVVRRQNSDEDEWSRWIHYHFLTRSDGRWLADRRDSAPLERRAWVLEEQRDSWRWEIMPDDFLDGLLMERKGETWVNVFGWWSDYESGHTENIHISSAVVLPDTSNSLLNALSTCLDSRDYKLPDYQEERMEFDRPPFVFRGWIRRDEPVTGVDEFDPHAGEIDYPPYRVGESIIERFRLSADIEQHEWRLPDSYKASLVCELWSSSRQREDRDEPRRRGKRMSASLGFLTKLCSDLECELIIQVKINRQLHRTYYTRREDDIGYQLPYCKIYILSADGTLRDERSSYKLR